MSFQECGLCLTITEANDLFSATLLLWSVAFVFRVLIAFLLKR